MFASPSPLHSVMIFESLAASRIKETTSQQASTINVSNPPPPDRPAAPRAPRFCRGGRLPAQRSLMSSSRGRLTRSL